MSRCLLWVSLGPMLLGCELGGNDPGATRPESRGTEEAAMKVDDSSSPSTGGADVLSVAASAEAPSGPLASDAQSAPPEAYRWTSTGQDKVGRRGASNVEITESARGTSFKGLGDDAHVPAVMDLGGGQPEFILDGWPSGDITIAVDREFGKTRFIGLTFESRLKLRLTEGGVVTVNEAQPKVSDASGKRWVTKETPQAGWFWLVPALALK
jgi:hypothetical protein